MMFIVNAMVNANLLSLVYPCTMFLVALVEAPKPHFLFWKFCLAYSFFVLAVKCIFELPFFCMRTREDDLRSANSWWPSIRPYCGDTSANTTAPFYDPQDPLKTPYYNPEEDAPDALAASIYLLVRKPEAVSMFQWLAADILLTAALVVHIYHIKVLGCWCSTAYDLYYLGEESRPSAISDDEPPSPSSSQGRAGEEGGGKGRRPWWPPPFVQKLRGFWHRLHLRDLISVNEDTGYVNKKDRFKAARMGKPGVEMYVIVVCIQLLIAIYIAVFNNKFSSSLTTFVQGLKDNQFSGSVVLALFAVIIGTVLDRVAYITEKVALKYTIQVLAVALVHWHIFVQIPLLMSADNKTLTHNPYLQGFYLLCVAYFSLGAIQLRHGYSQGSRYKNFFMRQGEGPVQRFLYGVYMGVPFLFETRAILDWLFTRTTLTLQMWLTVEWTFAAVFKNRMVKQFRKEREKVILGDEDMGMYDKCYFGVGGLLLILSLMVFPILLFSALNPSLNDNDIQLADMTLQIKTPYGVFDVWQQHALVNRMPRESYSKLLNQVRSGAVIVVARVGDP
jgi:hypothetical protein